MNGVLLDRESWIVCREIPQPKVRMVSKTYNAQKIKFFIRDFFSKCDQIRRKLRIWSH